MSTNLNLVSPQNENVRFNVQRMSAFLKAGRPDGRGADRVDATSRVWGRFVEHDSTEENLQTLRDWLERHGRPLALYADKNSLFVTTRPQQWAEQLQETPARTQFGRARPS